MLAHPVAGVRIGAGVPCVSLRQSYRAAKLHVFKRHALKQAACRVSNIDPVISVECEELETSHFIQTPRVHSDRPCFRFA
jgi:hypothetical protein